MIYAIGDSFTAGAELDSVLQAWPHQLSLLLNQPIVNQGKQGTGNTRIIKRAIDAALNDATLIILGWSDPARIEFADETGIYDIWPARVNDWHSQTSLRHRADLVRLATVNDIPKYHYANWLRQVILLQNFCNMRNVKCIMFIAYNTNKLHIEHMQEFQHLVNNVDMKFFVDNTMSVSTSEWTYGLEKMPHGHPSAAGHQRIANKIYEHIGNLGRLS